MSYVKTKRPRKNYSALGDTWVDYSYGSCKPGEWSPNSQVCQPRVAGETYVNDWDIDFSKYSIVSTTAGSKVVPKTADMSSRDAVIAVVKAKMDQLIGKVKSMGSLTFAEQSQIVATLDSLFMAGFNAITAAIGDMTKMQAIAADTIKKMDNAVNFASVTATDKITVPRQEAVAEIKAIGNEALAQVQTTEARTEIGNWVNHFIKLVNYSSSPGEITGLVTQAAEEINATVQRAASGGAYKDNCVTLAGGKTSLWDSKKSICTIDGAHITPTSAAFGAKCVREGGNYFPTLNLNDGTQVSIRRGGNGVCIPKNKIIEDMSGGKWDDGKATGTRPALLPPLPTIVSPMQANMFGSGMTIPIILGVALLGGALLFARKKSKSGSAAPALAAPNPFRKRR